MIISGETATKNGLKFCIKRDVFANQKVGLFLLFFLSTSVALNILSLCQLFHDFENLLHVPILVLPILDPHPFSESNLP